MPSAVSIASDHPHVAPVEGAAPATGDFPDHHGVARSIVDVGDAGPLSFAHDAADLGIRRRPPVIRITGPGDGIGNAAHVRLAKVLVRIGTVLCRLREKAHNSPPCGSVGQM